MIIEVRHGNHRDVYASIPDLLDDLDEVAKANRNVLATVAYRLYRGYKIVCCVIHGYVYDIRVKEKETE